MVLFGGPEVSWEEEFEGMAKVEEWWFVVAFEAEVMAEKREEVVVVAVVKGIAVRLEGAVLTQGMKEPGRVVQPS